MTGRDRQRFESFVQEMKPAMLRIARNVCRSPGLDPEDLVNEALERLLRQLQQPRKNGPAADPLTLAFVRTVMVHRYLDLLRRDRNLAPLPEDLDLVAEPDVEERWRAVSEEEFRAAIEKLEPPRVREAYRLHAEGLRYREIARRLGGIAEGTVGADLTEARQQLRKLLAARGRETE